MSVINVTNAAGLLRALGAAQNGDVIQLAAGTYSGVSIQNLDLGNVTIQSKDPRQLAVLTDLNVRGSSGLIFKNLEFSVDPAKPDRSFSITDSKRIQLDGLKVHGTMNGNPGDDRTGLIIRGSQDVSVRNSEFQQLSAGIEQLDNRKLVIAANNFHDIRMDGIRGGGSSDVTVSKNHFTDFYPAPADHPDAIQFWTTNTTESAKNITISENVIVRGSGGTIQGIFFRDQVGNLPFVNVAITDNLVVGELYNGIDVQGGRNIKVIGNKVEAFADQKSWIRLEGVQGAELSKNKSYVYLETDSSGIVKRDNVTGAAVQDGGKAALQSWHAEHGAVGIGSMTPADAKAPSMAHISGRDGNEVLRATDETIGTNLSGYGGDDKLFGGKHGDLLIGGAGDDVLTGGAGADQFRFFGNEIAGRSDTDRIQDLNFGEGDRVVFLDFGANTFAKEVGGYAGGTSAIFDSYSDIVKAAAASDLVTAFREDAGSKTWSSR